MVNIIVVVK